MNGIKEEINLNNINKIYYDLKSAMIMANTSNQTLYTYANDENNGVKMIKFKGKNYLHIDDINYIKDEVKILKNTRNSSSITVKNKEIDELNESLKEETIELKKELLEKDTIINTLNSDINIKNKQIDELKEEKKELMDIITLKENLFREEQQERLNYMKEICELREKVGKLEEIEQNSKDLNKLIDVLNKEKDSLYKEHIENLTASNKELIALNNDLTNKFDKFIDSQQAFQVMLAQKEETSQKLIDKKTGFISKLFKR